MVVYKDDGKDDDDVRLISRNGRDHTGRFPEPVKALGGLKPAFILDGEVAVFDKGLISRFEWLRAQPKDGASARADGGTGGRQIPSSADSANILLPAFCADPERLADEDHHRHTLPIRFCTSLISSSLAPMKARMVCHSNMPMSCGSGGSSR